MFPYRAIAVIQQLLSNFYEGAHLRFENKYPIAFQENNISLYGHNVYTSHYIKVLQVRILEF